MQRYSFKGAAACAPAATEANAQQVITQRSTALRNNPRWNVVETGWTESAEAAAAAPAAQPGARATPAANAVTPAATGRGTPAANGGRSGAANATTSANAASNGGGEAPNQSRASNGGGSNDPAVEVANVIGAIFGTNTGGSNNGANNANNNASGSGTGGRQSQGANGRANNASGNAGNTGGTQNSASQVSSTLKNAFSSSSNSARGNQPAAGASAQGGLPNGALGAAQFGTTKLVVYGCGRQQEQIACVTDVTNQNAKDSLVQSAEIWKDVFIVDDRGDRHQRTNGFFLNIDGEQRQQLDISFGKTAKFILMFDNVQTRVQKVALRSPSASLDVEEIGLISPDAGQSSAGAAK